MALMGSISEGNSLVGTLNSAGTLEGSIIGAKGDKGDKGDTGDTGNGIASITKTSTLGLVDTYTITYTNGTTATFTVTNGADGQDGQDGADGHSPVVTASKSGTTTTVYVDGSSIATIEDGADGQDGQNGQDGYSPSASVSKSGDTATITITDKDSTTTATITDGQDGADGQDGQDGHTPVITASKTGKVTTVYVDGTAVATINDGQDGAGSVADVTQNGVSVLDGTTAKVTVPTKVSDLTNDSGFITDVTVDGTSVVDDGVAELETASQLRNGLMSALDKQKLDTIASGAEVNVQSDWNQSTNTADDYIKNKPTIPTNTSDLNNDSGFITSETDPVFLASAAHGISSSDISAWNAKQSALGTLTVTLTTAGWSSDAQTVTTTGVTSSNTVIVSPSPSDMEDYTDAGIVCTAQGTNTLTFECDTTPSSAIDVNVVII